MTRRSPERKAWAARNLKASEEAFDILAAYDYRVVQYSEYHFRINERLDIWPTSKKWWDKRTQRKGEYTDLVAFVMDFLPRQLSPRDARQQGDGSLQ